MADKSKTLIAVVLDRSGSMEPIRDDIIGGFNTFMADQRKVPGECTVTLAQFDDEYEIVHDDKPLADLPNLTAETYVPRGSTALNDAIGRTINSVGATLAKRAESDRPGHVIFVIITDGAENASQEFAGSKVTEMIKHQQDKYQWQFTYLAASLDDFHNKAAHNLGIGGQAVLRAASSKKGAAAMYMAVSSSVSRLRSGTDQSLGYTVGEQQEAENADSK
jgi:uncharacterized protein YegL